MSNPVMHFEIMVNGDVAATRQFYSEVFGWEIDANNPMNYGLIDTGGQGIPGGIGKPMNGPGYVTVYVQVDDPQKTLSRIESLGGTTVMPPMEVPGANVQIAMFKDPAGTIIGLMKQT